MALTSNLIVDAGSNYSVNLVVSSLPNGAPLDLTDYTVKSQIRKSYQSSVAHSFNPTISNPTEGVVTLQLSAVQSEAITAGRWLYDVEITSLSGVKTRAYEGIVTVTPQITKI